MIEFNLPDVKEPGTSVEFLGITTERESKLLEEMETVVKVMEREYYPAAFVNKFDVMQRFLKDIPLENSSEVFLLAYLCGKMFSEVHSKLDSINPLLKAVIEKYIHET